MFKNLLVSLFIVCGASVSHAALGGQWTGWGEWTFDGAGTHCDVMTLSFKESANKVQRIKGKFDCGMVALDLPPQDLIRNGNELSIDGEVVGSVDGNRYVWIEPYSPTVRVKTDITVDGLHMDYKEIWYGTDDVVIYVITGRLFTQGQ
ncbi:hypothetical protein [Bdellovibrio sp. NC01]|uniref:hypothetical protein n=1 Tax=Bdellovibrio sp. NC01 TaxID=2220073 RepID=UPI0011596246|nr:hypothetical protein [Bdellovibrio sp. NC01]QDK39289.1 hypothetical protein DOE51_17670 [Bdellovibrio sp. NC01]